MPSTQRNVGGTPGQRSWPRQEVDPIVALYSPLATYRALAFRAADQGIDGVRQYLATNFQAESDITCRFGEPTVSGRRAAVEWWASWIEEGEELTLAGVTVLRFDESGLVVDHRDYWNQVEERSEPYPGWVSRPPYAQVLQMVPCHARSRWLQRP